MALFYQEKRIKRGKTILRSDNSYSNLDDSDDFYNYEDEDENEDSDGDDNDDDDENDDENDDDDDDDDDHNDDHEA